MISGTSKQTSFDTTLPAGYTRRPATPADAEAVAHVCTVASYARGENETVTADVVLRSWQNPACDLATSSQVILNSQQEMVACISLWDEINPTHPWLEWEVIPGDDWETLTRVLLSWAEQRSLLAMARCLPQERFGPAMRYNANVPQHVDFIKSLGYQPSRYFYRMSITLQHPPTVLALPDGFALNTFDYPAQLESLVAAREDMWRDHYAYVERPLPETIENWRYGIDYDPKFDASMWYIATEKATGVIAGIVLCRPEDVMHADQGYIHVVGVRRDYRRHGLAQAMLTHAFADFWERGQKTICLGVDATSPTGATRLYERVGMVPIQEYVFLEKEMRPGVERMNTGE